MSRKKILLIFLLLVSLSLAAGGWYVYSKIFGPNVNLHDRKDIVVLIPTGSSFEQVLDTINTHKILEDEQSFVMLAKKKGLTEKVKPGRYRIQNGMSNNALVNMLKAGRQEPVKLTFNNIRLRKDLAERISTQIETQAEDIIALLNDPKVAEEFGLDTSNIMVIFLPNTYEIFWNTSARGFVDRMHEEYLKFWNEDRLAKAKSIGLKPEEICILASIVQSETNKTDEMSRIAGLYINRLNRKMNLEADPTVKFAIGDFGIKRVLKRHLEFDSPYNTYKYPGLPPGPICVPDPVCIDKVLDYEKHDYIFMCAKEDFSGYHNFARTNREHEANARRYQRALSIEIQKGRNNKH